MKVGALKASALKASALKVSDTKIRCIASKRRELVVDHMKFLVYFL